jgi:hypothetical protein
MAARTCPNCLTLMPAGRVAAYSDDLVCGGCQKPLEISALSRNLAVMASLAASAGVWWVTSHAQAQSDLGWVLAVVYTVIAFGTVAAALLLLMADLRIKDFDEIAPPALVSAEPESHGPHH